MADEEQKRDPLARVGPGIFIVTLVVILEFFWWFVRA